MAHCLRWGSAIESACARGINRGVGQIDFPFLSLSGQNTGAAGAQNTSPCCEFSFDIAGWCGMLCGMKIVNSTFGGQFYSYWFYFYR